jgi:uncharacterized protein YjbI with pentapeptide repeats
VNIIDPAGNVLFRSDSEDLTEVLEAAVKAGANLAGAKLAGANLVGAHLVGANLADANLVGADLADAYLAGANLVGADLAGANLVGADLAGANLVGAHLADANLADAKIDGEEITGLPVFIGPIGSRQEVVCFWPVKSGLYVRTGCFSGDIKTFLAKVKATHGANEHGRAYQEAAKFAANILKGRNPT